MMFKWMKEREGECRNGSHIHILGCGFEYYPPIVFSDSILRNQVRMTLGVKPSKFKLIDGKIWIYILVNSNIINLIDTDNITISTY